MVFTWFISFESLPVRIRSSKIKDKDYEMDSYFLGIYIRIKMTSIESGVNKKVVHFGIPSSRSLLKTIKRFLKVTNKDRVILDIAMRFFHVYFFLKISM
jgi:hypothetical protein